MPYYRFRCTNYPVSCMTFTSVSMVTLRTMKWRRPCMLHPGFSPFLPLNSLWALFLKSLVSTDGSFVYFLSYTVDNIFKYFLCLCLLHHRVLSFMFKGCPSVWTSIYPILLPDIWRTPGWILILPGPVIPCDV